MDNDKFFYCYSKPLLYFLKMRRIRYIAIGTNINTGNLYWKFLKTDQLDAALQAWEKYKEVFPKEIREADINA